jgi:NTP pyrophosphatase (non-canonical NTP hydrolase)
MGSLRDIDMTIKQVQDRVRDFLNVQGKDWTQIDNRFYLFTHMSEEMGELARHIITAEFDLNLDRTAGQPMPKEKVISLIEDDLGDIFYHVLKLAVAYNIDLAEAFEKTMSNIEKRYGKNRSETCNADASYVTSGIEH